MIAVFVIAVVSQVAGIAVSLSVRASPSAIAGILAAMSYVVALQIRKMRDRVHIDEELEQLLQPSGIEMLDAAEGRGHTHND